VIKKTLAQTEMAAVIQSGNGWVQLRNEASDEFARRAYELWVPAPAAAWPRQNLPALVERRAEPSAGVAAAWRRKTTMTRARVTRRRGEWRQKRHRRQLSRNGDDDRHLRKRGAAAARRTRGAPGRPAGRKEVKEQQVSAYKLSGTTFGSSSAPYSPGSKSSGSSHHGARLRAVPVRTVARSAWWPARRLAAARCWPRAARRRPARRRPARCASAGWPRP